MITTNRVRHATVPLTAVCAVATWAVVTRVARVHLSVRFPHSSATTVGLGTIAAAASIATLLGWALIHVLESRAAHPRSVWLVTALMAFVGSLALPIAFATTTSALIGLLTIHVVVASVATIGLVVVAPRAHQAPARARMPRSRLQHVR